MSDRKAFQVALLVPHQQVERLENHARVQPNRIHARRPFSWSDREKVTRQARACYANNAISQKTHTYLTEWCQSTLKQHKRPKEYGFLRHRWSENTAGDSVELAETAARYLSPKWEKKPRLILVVPKSKRGDLEPEPAEDHGNAPLTVLRDEIV